MAAAPDAWPIGSDERSPRPAEPSDPAPNPAPDEPETSMPDGYEPI